MFSRSGAREICTVYTLHHLKIGCNCSLGTMMELAHALCTIKIVHEDNYYIGNYTLDHMCTKCTYIRNTRNRVCVQLGHGMVFLCTNDYAHGHGIDCVYKWLRTLAWHWLCVQKWMITHIGMALTACTNDYAHWHGNVCTSCTTMSAWGYGTQPYGIAQILSCFVNNISNFSFEI